VSLVENKTRVYERTIEKNPARKTGLFSQLFGEKKTDDKFTEKKTCEKPQCGNGEFRSLIHREKKGGVFCKGQT
jgi:hypothetical protein